MISSNLTQYGFSYADLLVTKFIPKLFLPTVPPLEHIYRCSGRSKNVCSVADSYDQPRPIRSKNTSFTHLVV